MAITKRIGLGRKLTHAELDENFEHLDTVKANNNEVVKSITAKGIAYTINAEGEVDITSMLNEDKPTTGIIYSRTGYVSGFTYNVTAEWVINDEYFSRRTQELTSDSSDLTFDRIDVIGVNNLGEIFIRKGIAEDNPVKPTIDPLTELELTFINIKANSDSPEGFVQYTVYNENLQVIGGEYDVTTVPSSNPRIDTASTASPYIGSVSIEATDLNQYEQVAFTPPVFVPIEDVTQLNYRIKNKAGDYDKAGTHRVQIIGERVGGGDKTVHLTLDANYDRYDTDYQLCTLIIPKDEGIINIKRIDFINMLQSDNDFGFFLDDVRLVEADVTPIETEPVTKEELEAIKINNIAVSGESTKTLTVTLNNEETFSSQFEVGGGSNAEFPAYIFEGYKHYNTTPMSTNEPHFVEMSNGNILMVFRAIVERQWHQGNDGYVAGRISTDGGKNFGNTFVIFEDEYDDRNPLPLILPDGRIVVIFYISNVITPDNIPFISMSYVTSDDNGVTWSNKTDIITENHHIPHGRVLYRGNDIVFTTYNMIEGASRVFLWTSSDNFDTLPTSTLIITDDTNTLAEPTIVDLPDGKSILLARNNTNAVGAHSYYQYNSPDGQNFTYKGITNMYADKDYSVQTSIHAMIDSRGKMIVIAPQRLREFYQARDANADTVTRIYIQDPLDVYNSDTTYELKHEIPRPIPSNNSYYGYPDAIEINGNILVGVCDKYYYEPNKDLSNFNEMSNIFTFWLYPVENTEEVEAIGIEGNFMPIQNAYNLFDRVDNRTISGERNLVNYVHKNQQYKKVSNITASNDIQYAWKDLYLRAIANVTITLTSYEHVRWTEFEGMVDGNYTLTIVPDENMTINGESGGTYVVRDKQFYKIKMITDRDALLTIGGIHYQVEDDATFDPSSNAGTDIITYTI